MEAEVVEERLEAPVAREEEKKSPLKEEAPAEVVEEEGGAVEADVEDETDDTDSITFSSRRESGASSRSQDNPEKENEGSEGSEGSESSESSDNNNGTQQQLQQQQQQQQPSSLQEGSAGTAARRSAAAPASGAAKPSSGAARRKKSKQAPRTTSATKEKAKKRHNSVIRKYGLPADQAECDDDEADGNGRGNQNGQEEAIEEEMKEIMAMYGLDNEEVDAVPEEIDEDNLQPDEEYCETDLELEYSDDDFTEHDASSVYQAACKRLRILPCNKYLRSCASADVCLRRENFNLAQCTALSEGFEVSSHLRSVDLSDCRMTDDGMAVIISVLIALDTVHLLSLSRNVIGPNTADAVADLVAQSNTLTSLDLSHMGLDDGHVAVLKPALIENVSLTHLNLSGNKLGELGGIHLHEIINKNSSIEVLDVSWNAIRLRGAMALMESLKSNTTIHTLRAGWNGIADMGCLVLAQALRANSTLKEVDISNNRITLEGCKNLAAALKTDNRTLETLLIALNPITNEGAIQLVEAITENPNLTTVDATRVPVSQELMDRVEAMAQPSQGLVEARADVGNKKEELQQSKHQMEKLTQAEQLFNQAQQRHEETDNHHDQVVTYAYRDLMQKNYYHAMSKEAEELLDKYRVQRKTAEVFAHPRTRSLQTHEAVVAYMDAHTAALDAFLAQKGTVGQRKKAAANAFAAHQCDLDLDTYLEGYDDGTYTRALIGRFVEQKLRPHLRRGETIDEDKLAHLFEEGRELVDQVGGPRFAACLETYTTVRARHPKDNIKAVQTARRLSVSMHSPEDSEDDGAKHVPAEFDDLAIFDIACNAAQKVAEKNQKDFHAISEAAQKTLNEYAMSSTNHHEDLMTHIAHLARTRVIATRKAEEVKETVAKRVDDAAHALQQAEEKVEHAFSQDVENGRRPNLKLTVDDGRCHQARTSKDPWFILEEYLERHNLRLLDLFKRFDKNNDGQITSEEFHEGIKVIGVQLEDDQIVDLLRSMDEDEDGTVDYREMTLKRTAVKTEQAEGFLKEQELLNRARQSDIGKRALKDVKVETDLIGRTGGGLHLHRAESDSD